MKQAPVAFSRHARARMAQRHITEHEVLIVIGGGRRVADAAPAGASSRWRYSGSVDGRQITVIAADEPDVIVVITAY